LPTSLDSCRTSVDPHHIPNTICLRTTPHIGPEHHCTKPLGCYHSRRHIAHPSSTWYPQVVVQVQGLLGLDFLVALEELARELA